MPIFFPSADLLLLVAFSAVFCAPAPLHWQTWWRENRCRVQTVTEASSWLFSFSGAVRSAISSVGCVLSAGHRWAATKATGHYETSFFSYLEISLKRLHVLIYSRSWFKAGFLNLFLHRFTCISQAEVRNVEEFSHFTRKICINLCCILYVYLLSMKLHCSLSFY